MPQPKRLWAGICVASAVTLAGCVPVDDTRKDASGLLFDAPYPTAIDVCHALYPNAITAEVSSEKTGLIACPAREHGAIADRQAEGFTRLGRRGGWDILHKDAVSSPKTQGTGSAGLYADKTFVFYDRFHGTQVAYFTKDGREWLWYPGNRSALLGHVQFRGAGAARAICFQYPSSSYNPVTGVAGPAWECSNIASHQARIQQSAQGDVFNLSSGAIPFVMQKRKAYTLADLNR